MILWFRDTVLCSIDREELLGRVGNDRISTFDREEGFEGNNTDLGLHLRFVLPCLILLVISLVD